MEKRFNGIDFSLQSPDIVCFTDNYNIVSLKENITGTNEEWLISLNGLTATQNAQWSLSFMGNTITNVIEPQDAKGSFFYVKANSDISTAASMCRALRNCPNIYANFYIYTEGQSVITLVSKNIGNINSQIESNMIGNGVSITHNSGSVSSTLQGANVMLDIFKDINEHENISLEKTFYNDEAAFNISSVLSTFVEYDEVDHFECLLSHITNDGTFVDDGSFTSYVVKGFKTSYSDNYIQNFPKLLLPHPDDYKLWSYGQNIDIAYYITGGGRTMLTFTVLDSNGTVLETSSNTVTGSGQPKIRKFTYTISGQYYNSAYTVRVNFANDEVVFNIAKPLKTVADYTRVMFHNSYGGIGYFDFVGDKSETLSINKKDYYKNIYDYYDEPSYEEEKVYEATKTTEYQLTSQLLEKDGLFITEEMAKSKDAWLATNNQNEHIIITSVSIQKDSSYPQLFRIVIKYKKSFE